VGAVTAPTCTALKNAWDCTEVHSDDRVELDQESEKPTRGFPTGIAATAIIIIAGLFFVQPTDDSRSPDEPATAWTALPDPDRFSAVDIAIGFVEAYGSFDVDRVASYLAAEADLSGLEPGNAEGMPLGNRWLQAQGFKLLLESCEELNRSPSGIGFCAGSISIGSGRMRSGWARSAAVGSTSRCLKERSSRCR